MTAGLFIRNDYGTVQIDENYTNLVLTASGTVISQAADPYLNSSFTITVTGTNPLIAIYHGAYWMIHTCTQSGNVFTYVGYTEAGAGTAVQYYVFDRAPHVANASRSGLLIWNGSGQVVFNSDMRPLRISGVLENAGNGTFGFAAGRAYAVIMAAPFYSVSVSRVSPTLWISTFHSSRVATSGANILCASRQLRTPLSSGAGFQVWPPNFYSLIVVDVTNY
ncbi:hypothetical protein KXR64_16700 [Brucella intermedia]|uniref:hypothetical protein n=1 Tax=Brucella TaxID=234 RepID=UPI00094667C9|nr:hypothetical protein [Brucella intermedia]